MDPADRQFLIAFGQRLRELRLRHSLSQEDLAARCGLHRTYIGSVERGERNLSVLNVARIASALGVTPSALLDDPSRVEIQSRSD